MEQETLNAIIENGKELKNDGRIEGAIITFILVAIFALII